MKSLRERLVGRVDTAHRAMLSGKYRGLCFTLEYATDYGDITDDEHTAARNQIARHRRPGGGGFMLDGFISTNPDAYPCPGLPPDDYCLPAQPEHVVVRCADQWREWALRVLEATDKELGYAEHS